MSKKILITGATGFIGQNLVEYFINNNYDVTGTWSHNEPKKYCETVSYMQADLSNSKAVEKLFDSIGFDAVIHLAGQMKGKYVRDFLRNSVEATDYLINLAEKQGVKTFIYASSLSIYGNTDSIVNEKSDRVNLDDYGTAKYVGERLLEDSNIENRIAIRLTRMLGKNIDFSYPWLPKLAKELMTNKEIKYFNPELMYNNLAHVDTLGNFIIKMLKDKTGAWNGYRVMGLGASEPLKVIDIINYMKQGLNSTSPLTEIKENLPRHTTFLIDISLAEEYGYEPWTVKETLTRFINDIKKHKI